MLASSKHKYSKTLAFPDTYYELIINVLQSVELFCAYVDVMLALSDFLIDKNTPMEYFVIERWGEYEKEYN